MVELSITLPEGFLEEEERCGYTVSRQMKEVWAVELDMLVKLLEVCKRHDIKIFAGGGTMLGAVRHNGFIPWDDDIDMVMFREDYDKLCAVAQEEFKYPYFFQTEYTDPGSLRGHAQLRNSQTTGILKCEYKQMKFNQGIFLDIFPMDSVVENETLFRRQRTRVSVYRKLANVFSALTYWYIPKTGLGGGIKRILRPIANWMERTFHVVDLFYKMFEKECQRYNGIATKYISPLSFQFNTVHFQFREHYLELVEMPFEFLSMPVGKKYHEALTQRYGDYSKFVIGTSIHGDVIFDTEKSFEEYIS